VSEYIKLLKLNLGHKNQSWLTVEKISVSTYWQVIYFLLYSLGRLKLDMSHWCTFFVKIDRPERSWGASYIKTQRQFRCKNRKSLKSFKYGVRKNLQSWFNNGFLVARNKGPVCGENKLRPYRLLLRICLAPPSSAWLAWAKRCALKAHPSSSYKQK